MRRTITLNGQPLTFAVSGSTPRIYRQQCGRDIFRDMTLVAGAVGSALDGNDEDLNQEILTIYENLAYCMAYAADPANTPDTVEEWLDSFPSLPIRIIFPQIELLWLENLTQQSEPVKK